VQILFNNNTQIELTLFDTAPSNQIQSMYRHLQSIDLVFRNGDNPFYTHEYTYGELVNQLAYYGKRVSVDVDTTLCLANDQQYFNSLHEIYEKKYNGLTDWLNFHEHIHLCENYGKNKESMCLILDHREKAGLLKKKFDIEWLKDSVTQVCAGDVYVRWAELGKMPYTYWANNEPNDIARMCELAKPWNTLYATIRVALENIDLLADKNIDAFNTWWAQYHDQWCEHWQIPSWPIQYQYGMIKIGKVSKVEEITKLLKNKIYPTNIFLS
jgi:hypothetical protein